MPQTKQGFSLKVLTINTHKGFTTFNHRFPVSTIAFLPELRKAVGTTSADIIFLQEVIGTHAIHPLHHEN